MISTSFPDLFALFYVPSLIFKGNVYSLVIKNKNICLWLDATYPGLYYLISGSYINLIKYFRLIDNRLFSSSQCPIFPLIWDKSFLFWSKLPFLFFHFFSARIFSLFFKKNQYKWFLFWFLNPIIIFISFIQGQYDIVPVFFYLISLYSLYEKNIAMAFFTLGIGGAFKHYPFLLIPYYFLYFYKTAFFKKTLFLILALLPFVFGSSIFFGRDFLFFLKFSENFKMLKLGIEIFNIHVSYYFIFYFLLLFSFYIFKKKSFNWFIKFNFLVIVIYYLFTFWFVQRLMFLIPSLLILSSKRKKLFHFIPVLSCVFFLYALFVFPGLFDHSILRPMFPRLSSLKTPFFSINSNLLKSVVSGVFKIFFIFLSYLIMTEKTEDEFNITWKQLFISFFPLCLYLVTIFTIL